MAAVGVALWWTTNLCLMGAPVASVPSDSASIVARSDGCVFSCHSLHGQNCLLPLICNTNVWRKLAFTFFVERFRDRSPWRVVVRREWLAKRSALILLSLCRSTCAALAARITVPVPVSVFDSFFRNQRSSPASGVPVQVKSGQVRSSPASCKDHRHKKNKNPRQSPRCAIAGH